MGDMSRAVYDELRAIARSRLASQNAGHTLQPTALVNEAWIKLCHHFDAAKPSRHFFATAAEAMRQILIDHARGKQTQKRGGDAKHVDIEFSQLADKEEINGADDSDQILALDEAVRQLEKLDPQAAEVVKLRFFAGLSVEETAAAMEISERTVKRDWQFARTWLQQQVGPA